MGSTSPPLMQGRITDYHVSQSILERRNRKQKYLADTASSSLPLYLRDKESSIHYKPEFRKSCSQPTRSLSPSSVLSQSPSHSLIETPTGLSKKRQLPQLPQSRRHHLQHQASSFDERPSRSWNVHQQPLHSIRSAEILTPTNESYFDYDIDIHSRPSHSSRHYSSHQQHRSSVSLNRDYQSPTHSRRSHSPRSHSPRSHSPRSHSPPHKTSSQRHIEFKSKDEYIEPSKSSDDKVRNHHERRASLSRNRLDVREGAGEESGNESETSSASKISAGSAYSNASERPKKESRTLG